MTRFLVGTRKGLFRVEKQSHGQWAIVESWFLGEPVPMVLAQKQGEDILACLDLGHFGNKMRRTRDGGATWKEETVPSYPEQPEGQKEIDPVRGLEVPWSVKLLWSLAASPDGTLWCGTIPGGLFRSEDDGATWSLVESLWHDERRKKWSGGGYDFAGIHSILIHPENPQQITVGVSVGGVWQSQDGGASWEVIGEGLRAEYMPPEMAHDLEAQDPHVIVSCAAAPEQLWMQHHNGIFRSHDWGRTWTEFHDVKPAVFGFAVAVHPKDPDTAWFVPAVKDEQRIPAEARPVVTRTQDGGKSFSILSQGLPEPPAYDLVFRHALDINGDGSILAFGSTTGSLWISEDQGESWQVVSEHLPPIYCVRADQ